MKVVRHSLEPIVIPAAVAHSGGFVTYEDDGTVLLRHPLVEAVVGNAVISVPPRRQFPAILATFMDLSKALSSQSNSPRSESKHTLREEFDDEFARYRSLLHETEQTGLWEPDYGSYVYDHVAERLYLVAPERWHRVALTTGATAMISGGIAGKVAALYLLGHRVPARAIYDFSGHCVSTDTAWGASSA